MNLIANGTLALLRNPDQLALLRSTPQLAANAVGILSDGRLASGNRDPSHWGPDAERLRPDRPDARGHLSFDSGVHHCLGAALARLEGRIALQRRVERFPRLEQAENVEWNGRINLRGPLRLPVSVG